MITSIVVKDKYTIGMNSSRKIKLGDNVLSVDKEVPFIRYRFSTYADTEFTYINNMMQQFCNSTHLIEISLDDNTKNVMSYILNNNINIAKYLYISITDAEVVNKALQADVISKIAELNTLGLIKFDRIMLKDNSNSLDTVTAKKIIETLSTMTGLNKEFFGVCSSPLSFGDWCCLTAVKARELMSTYSAIADVALPSANHQCMNCCGCIRYIIVEDNTEAPADAKVKAAKSSTSDDSSSSNTSKKPKAKSLVQFGAFNL